MKPISLAQSYELLQETLGHIGTFLLDEEMVNIEWHVFEEFDSESITFLHENTLDPLLYSGYISAEVYSLCQLLRKKFRDLEETSLWNAEAVKSAPEWYEVLSVADKINSLVNGKA